MANMLLLDKRTQTVVEDYFPREKLLQRLGCFFSLFSDETRLKIICVLCVSDMCVTDVALSVKMNQTTVSHQLKILREGGLVKTVRQGKIVFYCIDSEKVDKIMLSAMDFLGM